jgi:hypothetical protein
MENDYGNRFKIFLDKNIPVHIRTFNGKWVNGMVLEIGSQFVVIDEFKFGRLITFFSEIDVLETYTREIKE